jgi:hypothetical protein
MFRAFAAFLLAFFSLNVAADPVDDALQGKVGSGTMTESVEVLADLLAENPDDDRVRLALGMLKVIKTGESSAQWLYRYGAGNPTKNVGMFVFPMLGAIPANENPERIRYEDIDTFIQSWMTELAEAEAILTKIKDGSVGLDVDLAQFRFDLNGDGVASDNETAGAALTFLFTGGRNRGEEIPSFIIGADRTDAEWLIAYCHVFMGFGELHLAHNQRELFERAGHLIFPNIETPHSYIIGRNVFDPMGAGVDVTDFIAAVHLLRFDVDEPERMEAARQHFLRAIGHSRIMWVHAMQETDNHREWLPNPDQEGAMRGMEMTVERIRLWHDLLSDSEAALNGKKLVRFWRGDGTKGINLRRVFAEPQTFDLLLWIQGTAAADYLEEGELTRDFLWQEFEDAFGDEPFRYIFYVN